MKLLAVVANAYPLFGGAQISIHALLRRLRRDHGWNALVATPHHERVRTAYAGIPFETYRDVEELRATARRFRPDAVLGSLESILDGLRVAKRFGLPSIASFQSFEWCPPSGEEIDAWGVSARRVYPPAEDLPWIVETADRLVANSAFLRGRMRESCGAEAEVTFPEFEPSDFLLGREASGSGIVGVCGHLYKGSEIFLALADAFPNETFLLAGDVDPALARDFAARPNVRAVGRVRARSLFARAKVVLMPSRWPEPFGRVALEGMANGIATLASRTGGLAEIVGDSPLGVDAFCDPDAWVRALGALLGSEEWRRENAAVGRRLAKPFLAGESTRWVDEQVRALLRGAAPDFATPLVAIRGGSDRPTAYSMVNARFAEALSRVSGLRVVEGTDAAELRHELPDVTVWHDYGEDFAVAEPPDAGRWVAVRTWDFGPYPPSWARRIENEVDRLVVHSRFVRDHAVASGVPASRVRVVPLGFDDAVFVPEGPRHPLATKKGFRFVFAGAPVARKGAGVLLDAYLRAFGPDDDVCLVIKDNPRDVFYEGERIRDRILEVARDPSAPEVEYVCELLPVTRLAALYRACHVGVFPYRAEGFCLPILETMATGVPSIVPRFGSALDFCSDRTSLRMPVRRVRLPVGGELAINTLGFRADVEEVEFCEVELDTLVAFLRRAAALSPAARTRLARAGVERARQHYRWSDVTGRLLAALPADAGVPFRLVEARRSRARERRRFAAARDLLLGASTGSS